MSSSQIYHLIGHILSLAVAPRKKDKVADMLFRTSMPWPLFISKASNHLVLPSVYIQLRENDLIKLLPEIITDHLQKIHSLNLERNKAIMSQSVGLVKILAAEDIQLLFMKGVGNIFDNLYRDTGERMIQDIDVLVHPGQWEHAVRLLKLQGYRNREMLNTSVFPPRKHYPRLLRDDSTVSIEVHRFPVGLTYGKNFTVEKVWEEKVPASIMGNCFVMCDEHKLIHNFIHSQLEHKGHFYARIFLRNLYDHLLLSRREDTGKVFSGPEFHPRRTAAYMEVAGRTFGLKNELPRYPVSQTGLYPLRHELFLRSRILGTGMRVIVRMYTSYVLKPVKSLSNPKLRRSMVKSLLDKKWYGKHLRSYRKIFRS